MTSSDTASTAALRPAAAEGRFGLREFLLYAVVVFAWSTSWIAMKFQIAGAAPEAALFWRFLLSAVCMWIWVAVRRERVRFPLSTHLGFAGLGFFIFSMNFDLFYHGAASLPSGLLSVVFSLASIVNLLMGFAIFRQPVSGRVFLGGLFGAVGVAAMFWPRIAGASFDHAALLGLAACVLGTIFFSTGNMISGVLQKRGVGVLSSTAWGMTWAIGILAVATPLGGSSFAVDLTPAWIVSLLWLSLVSTVAAFLAYLTLLGRIGSARAGYSTVMFPVFALAISTVFEGWVWTLPALGGLVAVLCGNLLVLGRRG